MQYPFFAVAGIEKWGLLFSDEQQIPDTNLVGIFFLPLKLGYVKRIRTMKKLLLDKKFNRLAFSLVSPSDICSAQSGMY